MTHTCRHAVLVMWLAAPAAGAVKGPPKQAYQDRPDDVRSEKVVEVTAARQEYAVCFAGTVDGRLAGNRDRVPSETTEDYRRAIARTS